jgi:hypothetical protein
MKERRIEKIRFNVEGDLRLVRPGIGSITITSNAGNNIDINFSSFRMLTQSPRSRFVIRALSTTDSSVSIKLSGRRLVKVPAALVKRFV